MAEAEKTYTIHNMCRAQSSRAQRAGAVTTHRAALWIDGQKVLPKRPLKISAEDFKRLEDSIITKLREGRLAFTTPEQYYVDSRPDGRIYVKRPGMQIVEEKEVPSDVRGVNSISHWRHLFEKPAESTCSKEGAEMFGLVEKEQVPPAEKSAEILRADHLVAEVPAPIEGGWVGPGPQDIPVTNVVPVTQEVPPVVDSMVAEVKPEESAPTTTITSEETTKELSETPVEEPTIKSKKRRR